MKLRNKKTGDIVYVDFQVPLRNNNEVLDYYIVPTLKELNESFEDYKQTEPLIKDEKIRKAVKAWAEGNDFEPDYEFEYSLETFALNAWQANTTSPNSVERRKNARARV